MKKVFVICLALLLMFSAAAAADGAAMSVRRADGVGKSVNVWEKSINGQLYLFLPAYMNGQPLVLEYEGMKNVAFGELPLASGEQTELLQDGVELQATIRGKKHSVRVMASENLPAVHIETSSGSLDYIHKKKGNKEKGSLLIVTQDGAADFEGELDSIKGHGNATFVYEKKSYQIKLEKKDSLLGMDKGKTYVLLANQHENSLLRNRITFALAQEMGLAYTSECRSVDLYVNGEYRGSYLLCDKVAVSSGSVDIDDSEDAIEFANEEFLDRGGEPQAYGTNKYEKGTYKGVTWPREPEDITGGYLFELEYSQRYKDEVSGVVTGRGQAVVVKSPEEMSAAQGEYVFNFLTAFENAIFAPDGRDKQTGKHYTELADFDSLVRKYMIEEISKNYDANKSSQYFYKDSDSVDPLIYAGPVWDYDSAWGNYAQENRLSVAKPEGMAASKSEFDYAWWPALYAQPDFSAEVRRLYDEQVRATLEVLAGQREAPEGSALCSLDAYAQELQASAEMNFERWRVLNHNSRAVKTGATYEENIEYLRSWIIDRMEYLDANW